MKKTNFTFKQRKNFAPILETSAFVSALIAIADQNPEGFTVDASTLEPVTTGYSVAIAETQNSFGPAGLENVHDAIICGMAECVGGWFDSESGKYYFDAVNIYRNKYQAIEIGRANSQIAIFDLDNLDEIRL